jgi:GABA permease
MRRYLVVANRTLGGDHILRAVRQRMHAEPSEFWLVVPAVRPASARTGDRSYGSDAGDYAWADSGESFAQERLDRELQRLREAGVDADGEVGDADPYKAVSRTMADKKFDEILLSVMPRTRGRWLRQDLPRKLQKFGVPVTQVVSD